MSHLGERPTRPGQVRAVYDGNFVSFPLRRGATLRDLALHLARIEARNGRKPISIDIKFDA